MGKRLIPQPETTQFIITLIVGIIIIEIFLSSCAVSKKEKTSTSSTTETTEVSKDKSSDVKVNKAIEDSATFKVAQSNTGDKEYDEAVNRGVSNVLRSINFQKSSGDNSYRVYYDEKLKALQAEIQVAKTQDSATVSSSETNTEKSVEQEISEYIKKIVIPWWMYLIAAFLLRKPILAVAGFIYPPIKALTSLKSLMTPPGNK